MPLQRIGVIGCGLMGSGIAQVSAQAGFTTLVREVSPNALEKGLASIHQFLAAGAARGKVTRETIERVRTHLKGTVSLADLADCDLVIEAAPEQLALKRELFGALESVVKPGAILASNTSSLSITELSTFARRPDRFDGLHFFNPVPLMGLVELVRTVETAPQVLTEVRSWCMAIGKTVVECGDTTGFVVNRLLVPYMLDAIRVFEQGLAERDAIDAAMKLGCGHPMGPLMLADYVGLDTTWSISEIMFDEFKESRFASPPLLRRMVLAGRLGRKSGRGFYDWSTSTPT